MNPWLQFFALLAIGAGLVAAFYLRRDSAPRRVQPPPRSKRLDPPCEETAGVAKLFVETIHLKEGGARWPGILRGLNTEDDPHTRTLLLELRALNPEAPQLVLAQIESVCILAKQGGEHPTRTELLERAKASLVRASQS